jgi:hypothetical protein
MTSLWVVTGLVALAWIGLYARDRYKKKCGPLRIAVRKPPPPVNTDAELHVLDLSSCVMVMRQRGTR